MNAEKLIGTTLGTCVLQRVIGQGGMGAVYLAQQSRPRRQVAVKVLLPPAPLSPHQRDAFLERFRRETDAAASLEHPNIVPVYEYGEQNGFAYLVMPYISGGTLRDTIEAEERLALPKVAHYLDQLAAALDFAHSRGVIHRDIKPANILVSPEGRLLLTDFGLVKIIADGPPQARLTGAGAPVGTPDYMSPEQVIGQGVDGRADQYSLGIIVYQMVTGTTPFQGETPMQIASQHLQMIPSAPRSLRPELPPSAEQAIMRAMAKRPNERFTYCQDFGESFRAALAAAGYMVGQTGSSIAAAGLSTATAGRLFTPRSLFDPSWQSNTLNQPLAASGRDANATSARPGGLLSRAGMAPRPTGQMPAAVNPINTITAATGPLAAATVQPASPAPAKPLFLPKKTRALPAVPGAQEAMNQFSPSAPPLSTGALPIPTGYQEQGGNNTIKLTGPVKVVQMPIAGQPGRYFTGLLPVTTQTSDAEGVEALSAQRPRNRWRVVAISVLIFLLLAGTAGSFLYVRQHDSAQIPAGTNSASITNTPNVMATATAAVQTTATANLILSDPLTHNINDWPVSANEQFTGGAYQINNTGSRAIAVDLPQQSFNMPNNYALTMYEIKGSGTSNNNSFGMIFRFSQQSRGGKTVTSFYSFEVVNIPGGEYRFYRYNDSNGAANAWTELWHQNFGHEYHQGQDIKNKNTFVITSNGPNFTFTVNGKMVGKAHDTSLTSGTIGMLVNLQGTEVAFLNLLVTRIP
jgi:serine/threonine protein kinase